MRILKPQRKLLDDAAQQFIQPEAASRLWLIQALGRIEEPSPFKLVRAFGYLATCRRYSTFVGDGYRFAIGMESLWAICPSLHRRQVARRRLRRHLRVVAISRVVVVGTGWVRSHRCIRGGLVHSSKAKGNQCDLTLRSSSFASLTGTRQQRRALYLNRYTSL